MRSVADEGPRAPGAADAPRATPGAASNPETWVDAHGDYLFGYALARVRDPVRATDLVQETFLAALKGGGFAGRSTERTWLTGILKHKIADHFRRAGRETPFTDLEFFREGEAALFEREGWSKGVWQADQAPGDWSAKAGEELDRAAFWQAFWECVGGLPPRIAEVFVRREIDEVECDELCRTLGVSPNNLWVMLHRARLALRRCLENNWVGK